MSKHAPFRPYFQRHAIQRKLSGLVMLVINPLIYAGFTLVANYGDLVDLYKQAWSALVDSE